MAVNLSVATGNSKKFAEISEALLRQDIVSTLVDVDIEEIQSLEVAEVARDKALKAFEVVKGPVVVDDAGFYIEQYNMFPGTMSKFAFYALGYEGLFRLCTDGDRAYFRSYVAYMDSGLDEPQMFHADYKGIITTKFDRNIESEMPYAPLFVPDDGGGKRMGEMNPQERSNDHRHTSLNHFAQWYRTNRQ